MKINIEDYLQKIDLAFKEKSQKDIYVTYIMLFSVIFSFSYLLFWDSSFDSFEKSRKNVEALSSKIAADEQYLNANPESVISKLESEIVELNSEIVKTKDTNAYIKSKIETISSLIYDERIWGEYLDSVTRNAQKHNIKIESFTNKLALDQNSFGHVLDISIKAKGSYTNTLYYINSLEQSELVVDLHSFNIKAEGSLISDLNISVWGITY